MTLTVLMPVKDYHPEYLSRSISSVTAQSSPDWRLLVIVEPDRDAALDGHLAPHLLDERVELVVNGGRKLAGAFNTGMRRARTDFVAILLADDMWTRDAVAVLLESIAAHPEADFFHSARTIIGERDEPLSDVHPARRRIRAKDFKHHTPIKHLLCWRRELGLAVGGMDESLNSVGPDDFDFPWTMAEAGATFHAIPDCLYLYRDHLRCFRLTTHLPRSVHASEIRRIMRKHGAGVLATERRILHARRTYLRQCLYR